MRRSGLWHPRLAALVVRLGHGEHLVVADPGLPVPGGVEVIDLVYARGEPGFMSVLRPVLAELVVEQATMADELATVPSGAKLIEDVTAQLGGVPLERAPHEQIKQMAARARVVVRTGEDTPYANVVLRAGVPF